MNASLTPSSSIPAFQLKRNPHGRLVLTLVEVGPHDELMEKQGAYWRLYEAQARRAEEDAQAAGVIIDSSLLHPAHPAGNP